jgi:hypothetical protein
MKGIYIIQKYAEWIWDGSKKIIVKKKPLPVGYLNKKVYLIDRHYKYLVFVIKHPTLIRGVQAFQKLYPKHLISPKDRKKWWPEAREFYVYTFTVVRRYKKPRKYKYKKGVQTMIKKVKSKD